MPEEAAPPAPAARLPAEPAVCLNCGAPLGEPRPRFCGECGQETNVRAPTLGEFLQQFGGNYFATEGALWRTMKLLVLRPGALTLEYLAGRRKHYVLPLRLYLSISVLVFLLMRVAGSLQVQVAADPEAGPANLPATFSINVGDWAKAGKKEGHFFCEGFPQWVCHRLKSRLDLKPEAMSREMSQIGERMTANVRNAMFVLLPIFALWLKLVYRSRRLRYTEHLVFALHLHAFWFLALGLTLTGSDWFTVPALFAMPIYALMAMRRVYGGRKGALMLRALAVSLLYLLTLAFVLTLNFFWSVLF